MKIWDNSYGVRYIQKEEVFSLREWCMYAIKKSKEFKWSDSQSVETMNLETKPSHKDIYSWGKILNLITTTP